MLVPSVPLRVRERTIEAGQQNRRTDSATPSNTFAQRKKGGGRVGPHGPGLTLEASGFRPARVHLEEHARPIVALRPTGAGLQLQVAVRRRQLSPERKQRLCSRALGLLPKSPHLRQDVYKAKRPVNKSTSASTYGMATQVSNQLIFMPGRRRGYRRLRLRLAAEEIEFWIFSV